MNVYRITYPESLVAASPDTWRPVFRATKEAAHVTAKETVNAAYWTDVYIDELAVEADKGALITALNGCGMSNPKVLKSWTLTERGGMHECERAEA
jgi:hypothetical protein